MTADFSEATYILPNTKLYGTQGTYPFLAPECTQSIEDKDMYTGYHGKPVDIWAFGVTLWVFLFGTLPFQGSNMIVS